MVSIRKILGTIFTSLTCKVPRRPTGVSVITPCVEVNYRCCASITFPGQVFNVTPLWWPRFAYCDVLSLQDITPPSVVAWLKHPVKRVHVLLDRKGKTLSHAYVEMPDEEAARISLRTAQNSVLGKGKRARGVTVTRSSQEELMKSLFPSWQGPFDGCRPSLAGLSNEQVVSALEHGLVSETELKALLHLIRSPDVSVGLDRRK